MRPFAPLAAALACGLAAGTALAWSNNPAINTTAAAPPGQQITTAFVPDGSGGAYVVWDENRAGSVDIFAQHLDATGKPMWTTGGLAVTAVVGSNQAAPAACSDGAGGLVVAWEDARNSGSTGLDIFAQRLNAAGVAQWGANGVPVCNATGTQADVHLIPDGAGGTIAAWNDLRIAGNSYDSYAARLSAAGSPLWTANGVAVISAASSQYVHHLVTDGAGGAHVIIYDYRNGGIYTDVYWNRVTGAGTLVGLAAGTQVAGGNYHQFATDAIADGFGGVWMAIEDEGAGGGSTNWDVRCAHYNAGGNVLDYVDVCTEGSQQRGPMLAPDGVGGVFMAWNDGRNAGTNEIFAQHLSPGSTALWAANGVALTTPAGAGYKDDLAATSDGFGGLVVIWNDSRYGAYGIFGQRVNASGAAQWATSGAVLSDYPADAYGPQVLADGRGGYLAFFLSDRSAPSSFNYDLYLQRFDRYGYLGDTEPRITRAKDVPNDQGGRLKLEWDASYLEADGLSLVSSYFVYRSVPSAAALAQGLRLTASPDEALADRGGTRYVSPLAGQAIAWELVTSVTANDLPAYSYLVPTAGDSTALGNPRTLLMVQGRSGSRYWDSLPDSGYSVDNLAPLAPAPLTGQYAAGTARLHWSPNVEADLAGYRLYRGVSAGFTPSPSNLVAALPDTGYADAAGAPFVYKLTAVDAHGNESAVATLLPAGALAVNGFPAAASFDLARPWPSPAREALTLRFALPARGPVSLRVIDPAGRAVSSRSLGEQAAGEHTLTLPLVDDGGARLAPGLYFVALEHAGERRVARLTIVR